MLIFGTVEGRFTGKKLSHYSFNDEVSAWSDWRRAVNGFDHA